MYTVILNIIYLYILNYLNIYKRDIYDCSYDLKVYYI